MTIEEYFRLKGEYVVYVNDFALPSTLDAWMVIALMTSLPDIIIGSGKVDTWPFLVKSLAIDNGFDVDGVAFLSLPTGINDKAIFIEKGKWIKVENLGRLSLMDLCLVEGEPDFVIINEAADTLIAVTTEEDGVYVFLRKITREECGFNIK